MRGSDELLDIHTMDGDGSDVDRLTFDGAYDALGEAGLPAELVESALRRLNALSIDSGSE